ncbi:hypothetical protein HED60_03380 [Planctomycetales bacterium ZRK34]|nr:hypothetical protein HED60_03380 [Planctomycetales bacterium ZRK34]
MSTRMQSQSKFHHAAWYACVLMAALCCTSAAIGETIIEDTFADGGVTDGADPLDVSWTSLSNATTTVVNDAVIGDGNALQATSTGAFSRVAADVSPITLSKNREKIKIEFDLHPTVLLNAGDGIRFGLRNSSLNGGGLYDGYYARYDTGTQDNVDLMADANTTFGGGTQESVSTDDNASPLSDTGAHHAVFSVQLTDSGRVDLRSRMDTHVVSGVHTSGINTTFNQIGFQTGGTSGQSFNFDNYRITRWTNRFDDTFDVGSPATRGNEAADPNDTQWYRSNTSDVLSVVSDDGAGQIGSNDALSVDNTGTFRRLITNFNTASLEQVGHAVELSFDVRLQAEPTVNTGGAFRFGLFNSHGTLYNTDADNNMDNDDDGYHVQLAAGSGSGFLVQEFVGDGSILGGGTANQTIDTTSFSLADALPHYVVLRLTRVLTGMQAELWVDGELQASGIDTDGYFTTFNEVAFGTGNLELDYLLDNVVVDVLIPTPAALPAGLALLGLVAARRRIV